MQQAKILLITNNSKDAALLLDQIPVWYGDNVYVKRVNSIQEGFVELEKAARSQSEYDRVLWNPDSGKTEDLGILQRTFPNLNVSIVSSQNLSAGIRAYAQTQSWDTLDLKHELNQVKELLGQEVRKKSGGTERIQLNREIAVLEARYTQLKERVVEIEKLLKDIAHQITDLQINLYEKLNSLVLQVGQSNDRTALLKTTVDILQGDNREIDNRLDDLEIAIGSGLKPGGGAGKDQAIAVAIVTSGIGLIATLITTLTPVIGPTLNKWIDPDRKPTPVQSSPLSKPKQNLTPNSWRTKQT